MIKTLAIFVAAFVLLASGALIAYIFLMLLLFPHMDGE